MQQRRGDMLGNQIVREGEFYDPEAALIAIAKAERGEFSDEIEAPLRGKALKDFIERKSGLLFAYGMSIRLGLPTSFALIEKQDFDGAVRWMSEDHQHVAPVQLKRVVDQKLPGSKTLAEVLQALTNYPDSQDLAVVVHIDTAGTIDLDEINVSKNLRIGQLWLLFSETPDHKQWVLMGDVLDTVREVTRFSYPD